jgi:ABC-type Fe3+ transport system permease subunit
MGQPTWSIEMFDNQPIDSLVKAGLVFLVFLTIVLICFFTLYPVVTAIFGAFNSADWANAETQKATYMPIIESACTAFFAILISLPATWFIFWVFSKEPDISRIKR